MLEYHSTSIRLTGKSIQEVIDLALKKLPQEFIFNIKPSEENLTTLTPVIIALFLKNKPIICKLPLLPKNKQPKNKQLEQSYNELRMLQPYLNPSLQKSANSGNEGLAKLLIAQDIPTDFTKKLWLQLSIDEQRDVMEQIHQSGNLHTMEFIAPKLSWLIQNKILAEGILWAMEKSHFLPSIKKHWNKLGTIRGKWFVFADKPGGVEEGFLATPLNLDFFNFFYDTLEFYKASHTSAYEEFHPKDTLSTLIKKIKDPSGNGKQLLSKIAQTLWEQTKKNEIPLDVYMFKQDYEGKKRSAHQKAFGQDGSYVCPSIDRLKKDPFIKATLPVIFHRIAAELKKRFTGMQLPTDKNTLALIEAFVTNLAKKMGINAQNQYFVYSEYGDGSPKILSACLWKKGAHPGGHYLKGKHNDAYYVQNPERTHPLEMFKSMPIDFGGIFFIVALAFADRDFIGDGNNKMILFSNLLAELFAIDFGLSLQEKSSILNSLRTDFSLVQPFLPIYQYKNISAITDNPMTEKMMGMFVLFYTIPEEWHKIFFKNQSDIDEIKKSFQAYQARYPKFSELIQRLEPQGLKYVFKQYWEYLAIQLDDESLSVEWRHQTVHALKQLDAAFGLLARNSCKLMRRFTQGMRLMPDEVTLLDHWKEKFSDEISYYSACGSIRLHYPRVVRGRALFELQKYYYPDGELKSVLITVPLKKKKIFLQYLNTFIDIQKLYDITTFHDSAGKMLLPAECWNSLQNTLFKPHAWLNDDIQVFYENLSKKDPHLKERGGYSILKHHLLLEAPTESELLKPRFSQQLHKKLINAIIEIETTLTTDQNRRIIDEIQTLTDKLDQMSTLINLGTPLGDQLLKHVSLQAIKIWHQTFDQHYSTGILGFLGGQKNKRRTFFNHILSIFDDNTTPPLSPIQPRLNQLIDTCLQQSCYAVDQMFPDKAISQQRKHF